MMDTCPPCPATHPTQPGHCHCREKLAGEPYDGAVIYSNNTQTPTTQQTITTWQDAARTIPARRVNDPVCVFDAASGASFIRETAARERAKQEAAK